MNHRPARDRDRLLSVVVAVVTIAALYFARDIFIPIVLAGLLAFILTPVAQFLERAHLGRSLSAVLLLFLVLGVLGTIGWTVAKQLTSVADQLPDYQQNLVNKIDALGGGPSQALGKAASTVNEVKHRLSSPPDNNSLNPTANNPRTRKQSAPKSPVPVTLVKPTSLPLDSLGSAISWLVGLGLVFVFAVFMIIRREDLRNRFLSLVDIGHLHTATAAMDDAAGRVSHYLRIQLVVNTCYAVVIGTGLHFIGLPGALLWGAIAGILRFIPYLGPPLGAAGPLLLSLAISQGWHTTAFALALYIGVEVTVSQFIEPMLYGAHTGLSPVAVLVAAVFWTTLWGPLGLILSTPLTACLLVLARRVPRLAFLHKLLGDEPVLTPEAHFYQRMLAMDSNEAREVLESSLKGHSLEEVYESVLIPSLELAEQDRHNNVLDEFTERFVYSNTKELVEEIYEGHNHLAQEQSLADTAAQDAISREKAPLPVVACLPARDEADEIIAIMLSQVLERAHCQAEPISLGSIADMLREIDGLKPHIVCISALPPYAIAHARLHYRRIRAHWPDLQIIVGLWHFSGDLGLALNRIGMKEEGSILTSLPQVMRTVALAAETMQQKKHVGM